MSPEHQDLLNGSKALISNHIVTTESNFSEPCRIPSSGMCQIVIQNKQYLKNHPPISPRLPPDIIIMSYSRHLHKLLKNDITAIPYVYQLSRAAIRLTIAQSEYI